MEGDAPGEHFLPEFMTYREFQFPAWMNDRGQAPSPDRRVETGGCSLVFLLTWKGTWLLSHICLAHEGAASNGKRKTGKKIGSIGGQEGDGMGQVVGLGKASYRRTSGGA